MILNIICLLKYKIFNLIGKILFSFGEKQLVGLGLGEKLNIKTTSPLAYKWVTFL